MTSLIILLALGAAGLGFYCWYRAVSKRQRHLARLERRRMLEKAWDDMLAARQGDNDMIAARQSD